MNRINKLVSLLILVETILFCLPAFAQNVKETEYVVLVSQAVRDDAAWNPVVEALKTKHDAKVITFHKLPEEAVAQLKEAGPRYVAVVEKPYNIDREYIVGMHKLSRIMDEDIYEDFLWGIITGYDAASALRMIEDATTPMVVKTALSTATDMEKTDCFGKCALISQSAAMNMLEAIKQYGKKGKMPKAMARWKEKNSTSDTLTEHKIDADSIGYLFQDLFKRIDPELLLSCSYDPNDILYIVQNKNDQFITAKQGQLFIKTKDRQLPLAKGNKRRLYLAIGSDGGSMFGKNDNLAVAWMKNGNVSGLAGYCTSEWHGQAGWGTWKFWMTSPGRYTFSEALFLNMQFMLSQLNAWSPKLLQLDYPKTDNVSRDYGEALTYVSMQLNEEISNIDLMGYLYERDVFVYYGDPKWDVRLDGIPEDNHLKVTFVQKGNKCTVTIRTDKDYNREQMSGNYFKEEKTMFSPVSIGRLPFSYFFPERLKNPKLAKALKFEGNVEYDENFMFIHDTYFEPDQTYQIVFSVEK